MQQIFNAAYKIIDLKCETNYNSKKIIVSLFSSS